MEKKIVYKLKAKYTKADRFELNQKNARCCLLATESKYWFSVLIRRPYLYRIHFFLPGVKKIDRGANELMDIIFDKVQAIHNQNFEAAAAFRDTQRQKEDIWKEMYQIQEIALVYKTVNNGKLNVGIFHITKNQSA
ncbi:MAG: hypothetical protein R6U85_01635 [Salinivirgaceae bacterium]